LRSIFEDLEEGELKDLVEEIVPFSKEHAHNLISTLDDEDMKSVGLYSEVPLMQRYKNKEKYDRRSEGEIEAEEERLE
jgi:hypothetical protein